MTGFAIILAAGIVALAIKIAASEISSALAKLDTTEKGDGE